MSGGQRRGQGRHVSQRLTTSGLAAAATAFSLLLAGCSHDAAEPQPLPSVSASATGEASSSPAGASTTPTPVASPSMPPAAKGRTAASTVAFARHYVALINYAMHSGNTQAMRDSARPSCSTCFAVARSIDDVYNKSGRVKGGGWRVRRATHLDGPTTDAADVAVDIRVARQTVYASAGADPTRSRPNDGQLRLHLSATADGWILDELDATQ